MNPRTADTPVGQVTVRAPNPTTRRGTPRQERSPSALWPTATAVTAASSQGHHPAHPRLAISTREHQTGGAPTRSAPTRRGHPPRSPPGPQVPGAPATPGAQDRSALNTAQPPTKNTPNRHNAVHTLDKAVPHQGLGRAGPSTAAAIRDHGWVWREQGGHR